MTSRTPLFTFGTLMDAELLGIVSNAEVSTLRMQPALVRGFVRRWVIDDHYPVLVAQADAHTDGLLIHGLQPEALARIEFFEGEEFELEAITVHDRADDTPVEAVYFAEQARKPISDEAWTLAGWQHTTKADTLPRVHRYMQCYGRMSRAEADRFW